MAPVAQPLTKNGALYVNAVLAVGHLTAVAVVAGILIDEDGAWQVPVVFEYNVWNETVPDSGKFLIRKGAISVTKNFYPGWALIFCSLISGGHHLYAWAYIDSYWAKTLTGFNGVRWLDYAFSASVMVLTNEVLWLAPAELSVLFAVFIVEMFIVLSGGLNVELLWSQKDLKVPRGEWIAFLFGISFLVFCLFWIRYYYILHYGAQNTTTSVPDFVIIILITLTVTFSLFPLVFLLKICRFSTKRPYVRLAENTRNRNAIFEVWFNLLSALAKIPLLVFFATGLVARTSRVGFDSTSTLPSDDESDMALYIAAGVAAFIVMVVGSLLLLDRYRMLYVFKEYVVVGNANML